MVVATTVLVCADDIVKVLTIEDCRQSTAARARRGGGGCPFRGHRTAIPPAVGSAIVALDQLNRGLFARDPGMALCTAACVTLTQVEGRGVAEVVCAGHPPPLRVRGSQIQAAGRAGPMLGAWEEKAWAPVAVTLDPGDVLVLYTDGVVDTQGESERFGEQRLRAAIAEVGDAMDAVARIGAELTRFEVGEQSDDTAVLAVSRVPVTEQMAGATDAEAGSL
jgi:serine phosphatase RsbU (regulator of sigma subunit)